jgi:predicted small lipoprotein YifL
MKKVFLSLAVIAALTVVSCKQAEAPAEELQ